tara:strand:- start:5 stop:718 length:714 start_codon:yes stop_codon:yes gene_type:complete
LLPFVASPRGGVLRLLDQHDDADIRRRAALTCAKVLLMAANEEGAKGGRDTGASIVSSSSSSASSASNKTNKNNKLQKSNNLNKINKRTRKIRIHEHHAHSSVIRFDTIVPDLPSENNRNKSMLSLDNASNATSSASSSSHRSMLVRAQQAMVITERLIVAAVSDPDPRLRAAVLSTFANDSRYDAYLHPNIHNNDHQRRLTELLGLGSLDNLRSLFVCLNDESLAARRASICILGR